MHDVNIIENRMLVKIGQVDIAYFINLNRNDALGNKYLQLHSYYCRANILKRYQRYSAIFHDDVQQ